MKNHFLFFLIFYYTISSGFTQKSLSIQGFDEISTPSENGLLSVKLNNRWGYINTMGKIVIPCHYEFADEFYEGLALVKQKGKYGFINEQGKQICPFKYEDAFYMFQEGYVGVRLNGKWGVLGKNGNEIIAFQYDSPPYFLEGIARVQLNKKWGYINSKGQTIIPFQYEAAESFRSGIGAVKSDGKWKIIDTQGNLIYENTESFSFFSENILKVKNFMEYRLVDKTGKEVSSSSYSEIGRLSEGLAWVKQGHYEEKYGFLDSLGKHIIPIKYKKVSDFSEGLAAVKIDNTWHYIDKTGKIIISLENVRKAHSFSEGLAFVYPQNYAGCRVIDKTGKIQFSLEKKIGTKFENGFAHLSTSDYKHPNHYEGIVNKTGKVICPAKYETVGNFKEGMAAVKINKKVGFINTKGKEVIPPKYEAVAYLENGTSFAKIEGKWGLIDEKEKILLPFEYDDFRKYDSQGVKVTWVKKGTQWFLLTSLLNKD